MELPFAALRLKKVRNATAVVFKMLLVAESRFRRLNAQELLPELWKGVEFVDCVRKEQARNKTVQGERAAA